MRKVSISKAPLPSKEQLHKIFFYDATIGRLIWQINPSKYNHCMGSKAGYIANGCVYLAFSGQVYNQEEVLDAMGIPNADRTISKFQKEKQKKETEGNDSTVFPWDKYWQPTSMIGGGNK